MYAISKSVLIAVVLAPLFGAILAGLFGRRIGRAGAHTVTILGVATACALSVYTLWQLLQGATPFNENVYTFFQVAGYDAHVGFMIDKLTAMMMVVVTFVSLLVHVYTIGYMAEDPGYQRFFSYISLFTFSMLMLVMGNNFLQLFFGWEAVGLVSYLLIGFWFKRPSAIFANLKAFLVNRVGDFGFLLGIAAVLYWFGTLDYATVFANASSVIGGGQTVQIFAGHEWSVATLICICLFIGAMGKSAQVPLHVWLPDSMEGPTPISALIHAATMVTAGIFMVARMSPLFELSQTALDFVLFIGATTAFFTGLIGIVQNDIKRVVAYSTLSQLGYMTVALGVSAYSAAVYHPGSAPAPQVRRAGKEGVHRPRRRGRLRQDHALPRVHERARSRTLRHRAHPQSARQRDPDAQGDPLRPRRDQARPQSGRPRRPDEPRPPRAHRGRPRHRRHHRRGPEPLLRSPRADPPAVQNRIRCQTYC